MKKLLNRWLKMRSKTATFGIIKWGRRQIKSLAVKKGKELRAFVITARSS
jgi:hypothetical protein